MIILQTFDKFAMRIERYNILIHHIFSYLRKIATFPYLTGQDIVHLSVINIGESVGRETFHMKDCTNQIPKIS